MRTDLALVTTVDADNPVLGDLRVSGGVVQRVTGSDAIVQAVRVRLRWWRGEFFLDTSQGTPYLQELLGKGVSEDSIRAMLRREIKRVDGVGHVESIAIETDRRTRHADIAPIIVTEDGETVPVDSFPLGGV